MTSRVMFFPSSFALHFLFLVFLFLYFLCCCLRDGVGGLADIYVSSYFSMHHLGLCLTYFLCHSEVHVLSRTQVFSVRSNPRAHVSWVSVVVCVYLLWFYCFSFCEKAGGTW
uniref:Uncharacterized protein n=1 Tax=Trypanosoma congolense (strain IL3000) TaxID=1068625 RepID=G0UPX9_TRYCI|nr:hypothetical protein, unlikely [Trypanosoma congolense IL3000]